MINLHLLILARIFTTLAKLFVPQLFRRSLFLKKFYEMLVAGKEGKGGTKYNNLKWERKITFSRKGKHKREKNRKERREKATKVEGEKKEDSKIRSKERIDYLQKKRKNESIKEFGVLFQPCWICPENKQSICIDFPFSSNLATKLFPFFFFFIHCHLFFFYFFSLQRSINMDSTFFLCSLLFFPYSYVKTVKLVII